mgnify:CR=1 FL=1
MIAELTKTLIDNLKPKTKPYVVWDTKITGFGIKVTPAGNKVFLYRYRLKQRQRKYKIGDYKLLTVIQARKIAYAKALEHNSGLDPMAEKDRQKTDIILSDFCDRYLTEYAKVYKKPSSVHEDELLIRKYIKPKIGHIVLRDVVRQDVAQLHREMGATPYAANHTRVLLSKIFNLAEEWELREDGTNPCRHVKKYKEHFRTRYLSKVELESLSKTLKELDGHYSNPCHIAIIQLLLLTGARVNEIRTAKWEWIDFDQKLLLLPDSKTGKRTIFLPDPVIAILNDLPRIKDYPYILFGNKKHEPMGVPNDSWNLIRKKAGLTDFRLHDLRHSYATFCNQLGCGESTIAALLGHKSKSTITQRYIHHVDSYVKAAAEKVAEYIGKMLGIEWVKGPTNAETERTNT